MDLEPLIDDINFILTVKLIYDTYCI